MSAAITAMWWIFKSVVFLVLSLSSLLVFGILIAAAPGLVFLLRAVKSDWDEIRAIRDADASEDKAKEDTESLIHPGSVSSEVDAGKQKGPDDGISATDEGKEAAHQQVQLRPNLAHEKSSDPEGEDAPLKAAISDRPHTELDDFASPKLDGQPEKSATSAYGRRVVVVIPAFNEELTLCATLDRLNAIHPPLSLIVVADGGSTDKTIQVAEARGAVVASCPEKGRAKQMNAGAKEAAKRMREDDNKDGAEAMMGSVSGDSIVCFLHADTIVPRDFVSIVQTKFADSSTCCAGFVPLIAVPGHVFWVLSLCNVAKTWFCAFLQNPRSFLHGLRTLYGDQAICCCTRDFFRVGGFDEGLPILEDADLCERLHNEMGPGGQPGKVCLIPRLVVTSGRRFAKLGRWRCLIINLRFAFAYLRRASPEELHALYSALYKDVR